MPTSGPSSTPDPFAAGSAMTLTCVTSVSSLVHEETVDLGSAGSERDGGPHRVYSIAIPLWISARVGPVSGPYRARIGPGIGPCQAAKGAKAPVDPWNAWEPRVAPDSFL